MNGFMSLRRPSWYWVWTHRVGGAFWSGFMVEVLFGRVVCSQNPTKKASLCGSRYVFFGQKGLKGNPLKRSSLQEGRLMQALWWLRKPGFAGEGTLAFQPFQKS